MRATCTEFSGVPQDLPVSAILAAHTQKFDDILSAIQSIKSTLEPKIDALCIDMGHLREEHKKLKDRVASAEVDLFMGAWVGVVEYAGRYTQGGRGLGLGAGVVVGDWYLGCRSL
ncbi:hypothetical protein NDU88_005986 [Pleurodeles waltl]|uniref:Uncharacterized protein n=1 Tax=Pleurodeles waltl TaxID=8319 RepID=A0AAV7SN86_PLEWA|nr:hypothetical protein NDU88_005986 [Pleurodeles waltl]